MNDDYPWNDMEKEREKEKVEDNHNNHNHQNNNHNNHNTNNEKGKRKHNQDDEISNSIEQEKPPQKKGSSTPQKLLRTGGVGDSLALLSAPNSSITSPTLPTLPTKPPIQTTPTPETPPISKPKRALCLSNLYWVSKIGLPCIYYGNPGEECNEQINLLPISLTTNHYDIRVRHQISRSS